MFPEISPKTLNSFHLINVKSFTFPTNWATSQQSSPETLVKIRFSHHSVGVPELKLMDKTLITSFLTPMNGKAQGAKLYYLFPFVNKIYNL